MKRDEKAKDKKTAVLLACLPGGIFTWLYTYREDKKRFFRHLFSFLFWLSLALGMFVLLNAAGTEAWLAERNVETEISRLLVLAVLAGISLFTFLAGWVRALHRAIKRPEKWYKNFYR